MTFMQMTKAPQQHHRLTQSTIGVTNGPHSMEFAQTATATFTGAITQVIPAIINDPNTLPFPWIDGSRHRSICRKPSPTLE